MLLRWFESSSLSRLSDMFVYYDFWVFLSRAPNSWSLLLNKAYVIKWSFTQPSIPSTRLSVNSQSQYCNIAIFKYLKKYCNIAILFNFWKYCNIAIVQYFWIFYKPWEFSRNLYWSIKTKYYTINGYYSFFEFQILFQALFIDN